MFVVVFVHLQSQRQNVLPVEDGKGGGSLGTGGYIVAPVEHQRFLTPPALGGHQAHVRVPAALFGIVVAGLLLQVIAALIRNQKWRRFVVGALFLVLRAAEQLQPLLCQLHPGPCSESAVLSRLAGDDGMTDSSVIGAWMLK